MAYKKRFKKTLKRGTRMARHYKKKGGTLGSIAGTALTALKIGRRLMDVVNTEYKYNPASGNNTPIDYNGVLGILNNPAQGITDTTRTGDSIKCQHLTMRGVITRNPSGDSVFRVVILWVQNPIPSLSAASIFQYAGSVQSAISPKLYDNRFQTKFLIDRTYVMDTDESTRKFTINLPINRHTQFDQSTATITTGILYVLFISDASPAGADPDVTWNSRLTFTDN